MRRSLFLKIFGGYVLVSLLAVLLFTVYTLRALRGGAFDELTRGLEAVALTARAPLAPLVLQERSAEIGPLVQQMGREGRVRLTVIDAAGRVLADSEENAAQMENHRYRPEIARALEGGTGVSSRFSSTRQRWMVYVAVPVETAGVVAGVVRASAYREELETAAYRRSGELALFASLLFLACLAAALAFSRSLLRPLRDLSGVMNRFAAGDFGDRIHLRRRDEIRTLAENLNAMGGRVEELFRDKARRVQELDAIFAAVPQGIALLDGEGRVVRCNRAFEELAGVQSLGGHVLREIVQAPRLSELVRETALTGERRSEELEVGDRSFLCTAQRMDGRGEVLLVLHDTGELRRLETVKRSFVVNASHELRTPLTAIRGSIEMLDGADTGETARWVEAIRRNADRMEAIVRDLLLLSQLEAPEAEIAREKVDLRRVAADAAGMFRHRAETKGVALVLALPDDLPPVTADPFLVEQALVNLLDNALKYTERGEVRVDGTVGEDGRVRLEVSDTGSGIPPEHLPRIFERFYVVDRSRSRRLGGTGLGLSIVKHIVQRLGGSVAVESRVGQGTRFILRFPLN